MIYSGCVPALIELPPRIVMSMPAPGSPELELTCTPAMRPWSASIKLVPFDLVISDVLSTPSEPATFFFWASP